LYQEESGNPAYEGRILHHRGKDILYVHVYLAGLPDGLFSNQKSKFGLILEGLAKEDVGIFYGHLVHFRSFCYILWTFGIVRGNLVYFPFVYFVPRKIWQPCYLAAKVCRKGERRSLWTQGLNPRAELWLL
jgi:hypothetical protein